MSFSQAVKEDALVQCGRHCCLCHKFCGIKIELHHIKAKSDGGPDTLDNCIPLCLECHADQSTYDHKHPKGTKYTEAELRRHKAGWIDKCRNGPVVAYTETHRAHDIALCQKIKQVFRFEIAQMIWENGLTMPDDSRKAQESLKGMVNLYIDPNWEYIDPDIEAIWGTIKINARRAFDSAHLFGIFFAHADGPMSKQVEDYNNARNEIYGAAKEYVRIIKWKLSITEIM